MENYQELRTNALKNLKVADHLLNTTYPFVGDNKLLVSVMEKIFQSLSDSISSILEYELLNKRIDHFNDTFNSKFQIFKKNIVKLNIDKRFITFIQDIKYIYDEHKTSTVEFPRKGCFIICSDGYKNIITINHSDLKNYLNKTKMFTHLMETIVGK